MHHRFVRRRTLWFPTLTGWLLIALFGLGPIVGWWFGGERFLAITARQPARVLVVEGWIGGDGIHAAYLEYVTGGYELMVATGGLTGERWNQRRWSYAEEAEEQLLRLGVPRDRLLLAPSRSSEVQRTFQMGAAARRALEASGKKSAAINVFTRGAHARRSRLIFQKAFGSEANVGVIAWKPPLFEQESWWQSSERAEDLIKETVGYLFERLLNSGRISNDVHSGK